MDETLIHAWRSGDRFAQRRCHEIITGLVSALVEGTSTGFEEKGGEKIDGSPWGHGRVKVFVTSIVPQITSRGPAPWEEIFQRCVLAVARKKVVALRNDDAEKHPSPDELIAVVLGTGIDPVRLQTIRSHAISCAHCTDSLRVVRGFQRIAEEWSPPEPQRGDDELRPRRLRKRKRQPKKKKGRRAQEEWPSLWAAWPVFSLFLLFGYWAWNIRGSDSKVPEVAVAVLVDRTPPAVPQASSLPPEVFDVIRDLRRGDCWTASVRLRGIRKQLAEDHRLRILEGASFVCAGDGPAAEAAVAPLLETYPDGEPAWIAANALLLQGKTERAEALLEAVSVTDSTRRERAKTLLLRIDALSSGGFDWL
ncbi:MAG: hypothetical protein CL930_10865 [Deltaproteobacteria bacterium]|nr:hypothetical protein [Deltaproteobacteria bacterium]